MTSTGTMVAIGQWTGRRTDDECRAVATQLGQRHPAWIIWWGPKTRRYWALPAEPLPPEPALEHVRPDGLEAAMREVEAWLGIGGTQTRGGASAPRRGSTARPQPRRETR
ncbi:hypothetical protein ACSNOI_26755 [Actinomadura kijaniata]|uniref:hypothetical protein n=1 Tax=Actinomadura kijaniata TaxID=46161 RepID=UPI003F1B0886